MKVWQPGGHLSRGAWRRGAETGRGAAPGGGSALLVRLALPYRGRTAAPLVTLLAYTLVALAPPYLAKLAIDEGIKAQATSRGSPGSSRSSSSPRSLALVLSAANTYLTGWVGERMLADLRNRLFAPSRARSRSATTSATAPA